MTVRAIFGIAAGGALFGALLSSQACDSDCARTATCINAAGTGGSSTSSNSGGGQQGGGSAIGVACGVPTDCNSQFCVDGVCCDDVCDGACEACDGASSAGQCSALAAAAADPLCSGVCDGAASCAEGDVTALTKFGGIGYSVVAGVSAVASRLLMCGSFDGDIEFGDGVQSDTDGGDGFVTSRSTVNAEAEWSRVLAGDIVPVGVSAGASGNTFVAGWLEGPAMIDNTPVVAMGFRDAFVSMLDPLGSVQWAERFGAGQANVLVFGVAADHADGGVVIAGTFAGGGVQFGQVALNHLNGNFFIAKLDAMGEHMWSKNPGPTTAAISGHPFAAASAPTGGVGLGGSFSGTLDVGGGLWSDANGSAFVVVLDALGGPTWSRQLSGQVAALAFGGEGQLAVVGSYLGTIDLGNGPVPASPNGSTFVATYDVGGEYLWGRVFSDIADVRGAAIDDSGNVLFTGTLGGTSNFGGATFEPDGDDAFVVKLAGTDGTHLWSHQFGDGGAIESQIARGVAVTPEGVFVAGHFLNILDAGNGFTATANGDEDIFLIQLTP